MSEIKAEEKSYVPLPKFYKFESKEVRERVLYANFIRVNQDIKELIDELFNKDKAK